MRTNSRPENEEAKCDLFLKPWITVEKVGYHLHFTRHFHSPTRTGTVASLMHILLLSHYPPSSLALINAVISQNGKPLQIIPQTRSEFRQNWPLLGLLFYDDYPAKVGAALTCFRGKEGRFKSGRRGRRSKGGVGFHQHRTFTHSLGPQATKRTLLAST